MKQSPIQKAYANDFAVHCRILQGANLIMTFLCLCIEVTE